MDEHRQQTAAWAGSFGADYTDRNPETPEAMDALYYRDFGVTRTALCEGFLDGLDRTARVLEVGCNVGTQLRILQRLGFRDLTGVELQDYALRRARILSPDLPFVRASAYGLPFGDSEFDLVFTSGLLIHIAPEHLGQAMREIARCSRGWLWGWEYYADKFMNIPYRGRTDLLWKGDYAQLYEEALPEVRRVRQDIVSFIDNGNRNSMFLLRKAQ